MLIRLFFWFTGVLMCVPGICQVHTISLQWGAASGQIGDRNAVARLGYEQRFESGINLSAGASIIYELSGENHAFTGIVTKAGYRLRVKKKLLSGPYVLIGNEKNCWEGGAGFDILATGNIFSAGLFLESLNLYDKRFYPYIVGGAAVKIKIL